MPVIKDWGILHIWIFPADNLSIQESSNMLEFGVRTVKTSSCFPSKRPCSPQTNRHTQNSCVSTFVSTSAPLRFYRPHLTEQIQGEREGCVCVCVCADAHI